MVGLLTAVASFSITSKETDVMKKYIALLFIALSFGVSGKAVVCNPDGSYCKEVSKVLMLEPRGWVDACCDNVSIPAGHNCEDDCTLAKREPDSKTEDPFSQELLPANAYILFNQGYRAWVVIDGVPDPMPKIEISVEIIREYLPSAKEVFLNTKNTLQLAYNHAEGVEIIIQRPQNDSDLNNPILFTDWERLRQAKVENLKKEIFDQSISIYPNPASSDQEVELKFGQTFKVNRVELADVTGKILKVIKIEDDKSGLLLDLREIKKEVIFVRIIGERERLFIRKLVLHN